MQISVERAQLEMQQKLGRCVIRLQQYERLLKAMVATMSLEGHPEDLPEIRSQQAAEVSTLTLGTLVGRFKRDCLTRDRPETDATAAIVDGADTPAEVPSFKMHLTISMSSERYNQTMAALTEMKDMRNDLVHHLIERFNISEVSGCLAATSHLQDCYQTIDNHLGQLKEWADGQAKVQKLAASFMESKVFEYAFLHRISPDGTVFWPGSTIVECLREAENACSVHGWTALDIAIAFIMREHRDQTPTLYGCKTWRQVLMTSGLFEIRSEPVSDGNRGQAWYRSRAKDLPVAR
jgi:hypothetical protein